MRRLLQALGYGFRGHPIHPPLTDIVLGALTTSAVAVVVGWTGFLEARMLDVAFLSAVVGLIAALPTAITGFLDYLRVARGTSLRRTVTLHWVIMLVAVAVLLAGAALLQPGDNDGIPVLGGIVILAGWGGLVLGAWVGGGIVYYHGMRVMDEPDAPTREAVKPKLPPD